MRSLQRLGVALLWTLSLGLCACGATGGTSSANGPGGSSATTPPTNTVSSGGNGVTITVNSPTFHPADAVAVTVLNGSNTTITLMGEHTNCTPVLLEQAVNTAWQPIMGCLTGAPAQVVEIAPGASQVIRVAPTTNRGPTSAWVAGTYRASITFADSAKGDSSATTISSATFAIA